MANSDGCDVRCGVLSFGGSWVGPPSAGLVHLKGTTKLEDLILPEHSTGVGLVPLKGLANPGDLDLQDTEVTDAGVAELQQALPNCQITKPNGESSK